MTINCIQPETKKLWPEMNLLQGRPVTLTVATGILHMTHVFFMMIIHAKQYYNPTTNNKVIARKRIQDRQIYGQSSYYMLPRKFLRSTKQHDFLNKWLQNCIRKKLEMHEDLKLY